MIGLTLVYVDVRFMCGEYVISNFLGSCSFSKE